MDLSRLIAVCFSLLFCSSQGAENMFAQISCSPSSINFDAVQSYFFLRALIPGVQAEIKVIGYWDSGKEKWYSGKEKW